MIKFDILGLEENKLFIKKIVKGVFIYGYYYKWYLMISILIV